MNKLKSIRTAKGLSQKELAEKSGVSLRTLQHYECGDSDINGAGTSMLLKLAEALETPYYNLLDDELRDMVIKNLSK